MKLGIQVSPRTVQKYLLENPKADRRRAVPTQHWRTFVHNHAKAMLACNFFISVSVRFRVIYVFVIMEVGSRRLVHFNVTAHPTAAWTLQQFREAIDNDQGYRFLIHELIGSLRRGCLDFLIPMNERHLREILKEYKTHYNQGRPHSSLRPGFPEPRQGLPMPLQKRRHQLPEGDRVMAKPILGGLHHEYRFEKIAA